MSHNLMGVHGLLQEWIYIFAFTEWNKVEEVEVVHTTAWGGGGSSGFEIIQAVPSSPSRHTFQGG
jgi:hypothetical protein